MKNLINVFVLIVIIFLIPQNVSAETLKGEIGFSRKWGSGWLDLSKMMDFHKDDRLIMKLGGTAEKVLVRLLAKGISPDSTSGITGDTIIIPPNRIVELQLDSDYDNIIQISVHGKSNPWGLFNLGIKNGHATLLTCELNN